MESINFRNECRNRANANRLGKITVEGIEEPITNNDYLQSFSIDSGCYINGDIIGSVYAKCLKASFVKDIQNITDKSISAQIGVKYDDLSDEYINMGKYIVERPNNEITANMSQITAYDNLYTKLDIPYACGIDYSTGDKTLLDLYIDVCNQLELTPKNTTILNGNIPITDNPFTNGEKNRTVLQTIGKVSCSFIGIDTDTNKIDLCWLSNSEEPDCIFDYIDEEDKSQYSSVEGGQVVFGPINCLIVKNSQIDDENVTIKDDESISLNGEHSITISEDYVLYSAELRQQAITNIWNRVKGLTYVDCKLTSYYGKPFLKIGDKIRIYTSETDYFDTYVLKHNFTYDGTFTSIIESPVLTEQEIQTKQDISLGERLSQTEIKVNKQEKKIESLVSDTKDIANSVEVFKTDIETNNIIVVVDNNNFPLETANYDVAYNSTFIGNPVQVKPTTSDIKTGIVLVINDDVIRFAVNKVVKVPNLDNKYTFTFKYTDEDGKEYTTLKTIVVSLVPKGEDGATGPQGTAGTNGSPGKDAAIQSATPPTDTTQMWYDTNTNTIKRYNGSEWIVVNDYSHDIDSVSDLIERLENLTQEELDFLTGQVNQIRETMSTSFSQTNEAFEMQFKKVQQQIATNQKQTDGQINEILKYIRFKDGTILLGDVSNPYTLKIENDRLTISYNGENISKWIKDIAYFREIHIGSFAFIPRPNGSLSLVKAGE